MPVRNRTKCGDYYCDANSVCGEACTEMDIQEANNHAFAITPHKCSGDCPSCTCDRGGCGAHVQNYGPGGKIDTTRPFQVCFRSYNSVPTAGLVRSSTAADRGGEGILQPLVGLKVRMICGRLTELQ